MATVRNKKWRFSKTGAVLRAIKISELKVSVVKDKPLIHTVEENKIYFLFDFDELSVQMNNPSVARFHTGKFVRRTTRRTKIELAYQYNIIPNVEKTGNAKYLM